MIMGVYSTNTGAVCDLSGLGLGEAAAAAKAKVIHQRILKRICRHIDDLLLPRFEAVNEGEIGKPNSEIPDIVIWSLKSNMQHNKPIVAIEITTDDYEQDNKKKLQNLYEKYPTLQECFLFNYESNTWKIVCRTGFTLPHSHSSYLNGKYGIYCDFNEPLVDCDIKNLFGIAKRKRT